jgi:polysaccharide biosynthesis protein PslH
MRVLFLSPRQVWPLNSGAKLREYHLGRCLASQAELTLLAFAADPEPLRQALPFYHKVVTVPPPQRYTSWNVVRGLVGPQPLPVLNYTTPAMQQALDQQLEQNQFDLVQIEGTPMAAYVAQIQCGPQSPLTVYDWHNIESELMARYADQASWLRSLYAKRTARLLEVTESDMLRRGDAHIVCSEREQQRLQQLAPQARIHVISNGVDTQFFRGAETQPLRDRLLFVGTLDYHANILAAVTFAQEIWPQVHAALPHLRLTLVGANPSPEVRALAAIPGVEVTGTVPDLRPYYLEAAASVVPLKTGGGTRLKILEAMAAGVPVVSTAIGAEGIHVTPGKHLLIAESTPEWICALQRILLEPGCALSLTQAGRELAVQFYDWGVIGGKLCQLYRNLIDHRGQV